MRRHPGRTLEQAREMKEAEAGFVRQVVEGYDLAEMSLDVVQHASQPLRIQRRFPDCRLLPAVGAIVADQMRGERRAQPIGKDGVHRLRLAADHTMQRLSDLRQGRITEPARIGQLHLVRVDVVVLQRAVVQELSSSSRVSFVPAGTSQLVPGSAIASCVWPSALRRTLA